MKLKQIPVARPDLSGNEKKYLNECLDSTWISSKGKFIDLFEKNFAGFTGTKFAITTSNGTTALHLAMAGLGIGQGDEVIVPNLTFIASANAVAYTGAKVILTDVETRTWNMDPNKLEEKITPKTKAIMIVHLYGHPADIERIIEIARKHNLIIIEDAAEAHGAEIRIKNNESGIKNYKWKKVGSIGKVGCFSFYGNKIITTGEGGMVTTDDEDLAVRMKILRDHGQNPQRRYYHDKVGFNYRMTNMQAAIGVAQLERIEEFLTKKRKIAGWYNRYLSDIPGITLPPEEKWAKNVYWMYSVLIGHPYPKTRDEMMVILEKEMIETRPFFFPLNTMPPYLSGEKFPNSLSLSNSGINLPSDVNLNESDIKRIAEVFKRAF